jgi:diguanylate cyclase (GGDEF)-like protein/PAS domain S-box-containing protein
MDTHDSQEIRLLLDDYLRMYSSRDDRLTTHFSENFSGFTGGGDFLVKNRDEWVSITRQDFAQVKDAIRIDLKDFAIQSLADSVAVATSFFTIRLPIEDHILSRETARLVLVFRKEAAGWKISHSSISIPYQLVREGEVYPLQELVERNRFLEELVAERTRQLSEANETLRKTNEELAREIAEHKRAEDALRISEAHYRLLTEDVLDVVWKTDRDFRFTYISPSDERLRGFRADEVIGHHAFEMFTEEGVAAVTEIMRQRQEEERLGTQTGFLTFEIQHVCKDGSLLWGEVRSKPIRDEHGTIIGYHGITRETTERRQMQDQIRQLAFYDSLTGLPNRRLLDDRLGQAMATSKRSGRHGAVIAIDLDNFKSLNDRYGHMIGDLLLIDVAKRLGDCVRETDTVARFGGDEFVVILGDLGADEAEAASQAEIVAEKIHQRLATPYVLTVGHEKNARITIEHCCSASIGVMVFLGSKNRQEDILKWADAAMYQAKNAGRDAIRFYDPTLQP